MRRSRGGADILHLAGKPLKVGGRHGRPRLIQVDAQRAHATGIVFYPANRAFRLADLVPAGYLVTPSPVRSFDTDGARARQTDKGSGHLWTPSGIALEST